MWELVVDENTRLVVPSEDVIIGRRDPRTGFLPDLDLTDLAGGQTVSRRHARLFQRKGKWFIECQPTARNGTFVAGRPLAPGLQTLVKEGDEIRLGEVKLVFQAIVLQTPEADSDDEYTEELYVVGTPKFTLNLKDGQTVDIGRRDNGYVPDVDLSRAPDGASVFPHHAQVFRSSGKTFLQVHEEASRHTLYRGSPLESTHPVELQDGDKVQFGRVVATYHRTRILGTMILDFSNSGLRGESGAMPASGGMYAETPVPNMSLDQEKVEKEVEEVDRVIDRMGLLDKLKRPKRK